MYDIRIITVEKSDASKKCFDPIHDFHFEENPYSREINGYSWYSEHDEEVDRWNLAQVIDALEKYGFKHHSTALSAKDDLVIIYIKIGD